MLCKPTTNSIPAIFQAVISIGFASIWQPTEDCSLSVCASTPPLNRTPPMNSTEHCGLAQMPAPRRPVGQLNSITNATPTLSLSRPLVFLGLPDLPNQIHHPCSCPPSEPTVHHAFFSLTFTRYGLDKSLRRT
jgi:hypothetical protein